MNFRQFTLAATLGSSAGLFVSALFDMVTWLGMLWWFLCFMMYTIALVREANK